MNHQFARLPDPGFSPAPNTTAPVCKFQPRHYVGVMPEVSPDPESLADWSDEMLLAEWIRTDPSLGDPYAAALAAEAKNRGWTADVPQSTNLRIKVRSFARAAYRRLHRSS